MARTGLRVRGERGHPEVRSALVRFARWARKNYEFPVRVPVYLQPGKTLTTLDGREGSASFFVPDDPGDEPYIRIATGDYDELKEERGRDNALAAYLLSMCHELAHYFQWLETGNVTERGVITRAGKIMVAYEEAVGHP